ncbi:MAG: NADH:ubiquinone oxidoreductase subunit N, partial [Gammaproteobacteria bacterium]
MSFTATQLIPVIPEIFITFMIVIVMLADLFLNERLRNQSTFLLTQLTLVVCSVLSVNLFHHQTQIVFHNSFIVDHMACVLKVFIYATTFLSLLYSHTYIHQKHLAEGQVYLVTLFVVVGMMVLVSAYSFITLFIGLELLSLPLYAMIAM